MKQATELLWIKAGIQLPLEGEYVLIHLVKDNWHDSSDPHGVYFKVAKLEKGISESERAMMGSGALPNPDEVLEDGFGRRYTSKRDKIIKAGDENGNNLKPYYWRSFGPGDYFGQEVDYWMSIPRSFTT